MAVHSEQSDDFSRFALGEPLPSWSVTAVNDAVDSGNPIHDDGAAQAYGFGAGLVPGVTTYGYLLHPLLATFGLDFLRRGASDIRLRSPIHAGERLEVLASVSAVTARSVSIALEVTNRRGEQCALGVAHLPAPSAVDRAPPERAPLPVPRRAATPEALRAEPLLGTLEVVQSVGEALDFARAAMDELACYDDIVHPAWLLRQANILVDRSVAVGAWVHTASQVRHLATAQPGERITVSGKVVALYERKGHDYADLDIHIAGRQPLMRVLHTAIYRLADSARP
jgi:acyl dehydratase